MGIMSNSCLETRREDFVALKASMKYTRASRTSANGPELHFKTKWPGVLWQRLQETQKSVLDPSSREVNPTNAVDA